MISPRRGNRFSNEAYMLFIAYDANEKTCTDLGSKSEGKGPLGKLSLDGKIMKLMVVIEIGQAVDLI
jgi:hypothetical protein